MLFVELGRLVTPIKIDSRSKFAVIVGILDKNFVIIQYPLTMVRERVPVNALKLLEIVLPIKLNETPFDVQRNIDSHGAVKEFESSEDYKRCLKKNKYVGANDFERFVIDMVESVEINVLRERNII